MSSRPKIRSLAAAREWRALRAGPIVFTNGVFDLIHAGHVEYLEAARDLGQALVVGINSDQSVRRLGKGPDRPIVAEADRARAVAALEAVDCVVIFDQPTPRETIEALTPNILVKGGDYSRDTVVGADLVERIGGRVVIIPLVPDRSTTNLLERIRGTC